MTFREQATAIRPWSNVGCLGFGGAVQRELARIVFDMPAEGSVREPWFRIMDEAVLPEPLREDRLKIVGAVNAVLALRRGGRLGRRWNRSA